MRKEIFVSTLGHLVILTALVLLSSPLDKPKIYPTVYQVSLISLPKIQPKLAEARVVAQEQPKVQIKQVKKEKVVPKNTAVAKKDIKKASPTEKPAAQEQTATQQIEGLGEAKFEGGKIESPYYAGIVFAKIKSMWRNPVQSTSLQAAIKFRILKDGSVTDAEIETSSGNRLYDQAALRAVMAASPLPPLPGHYVGDDLIVHLNFVGIP
jgi:protein TonB